MLKRTVAYLDSNAGAPLHPRVAKALLPFLETPSEILLANPSSIHAPGRKARRLLDASREKIAASLGAQVDPERLIFTSSGTEANQTAIHGVLAPLLRKNQECHWLVSAVEHESVLQMAASLGVQGVAIDWIPVDAQGRVQIDVLKSRIRATTALVSVMWVNNETGVISDIRAVSEALKGTSALLHVDAAQAWGKIPIELNDFKSDLVSFSGHKIGALAGSGFLWVGKGIKLEPLVFGKQEKGRRGGTENLFGIIALGAAAETLEPLGWSKELGNLRDKLEAKVVSSIAGARVIGQEAPRVANTSNLLFEGVESESLVMALDLAGYAVSAGAACSSGSLEPSHVLVAMGLPAAQAAGAIRISLSLGIAWETLDGFAKELETIVSRIRK